MTATTRRARRMKRHHKFLKTPALNLISLMDIFTILVFFLLVNSSNTQQFPSKKALTLPTSIAKKAVKETVVIVITRTDILLQGRSITAIDQAMSSETTFIPALKDELIFESSKRVFVTEDTKNTPHAVTIMGDENIPYELLRKVLSTCRQANYTQIAFAAMQKTKNKSS